MKVRPAAATLIAPARARRMRRNAGRSRATAAASTTPPAPITSSSRSRIEGGFVPVEWTYTNFPFYSLYGDGTLIVPGAQIEIYPGPALPAISSRQVDEAGIQAILEKAIAAVEDIPADLERPRVHEHRRCVHHRDHRVRRWCGPDDPRLRAQRADRTSRRDARARVPGPPRSPGARRVADRLRSTGSPRARSAPRARTKPPLPACSSGSTAPSKTSPRSRCRGRSSDEPRGLRRACTARRSTGAASSQGADWDAVHRGGLLGEQAHPVGGCRRAVLDPVPAPPTGRERLLARGSPSNSRPERRGQVLASRGR